MEPLQYRHVNVGVELRDPAAVLDDESDRRQLGEAVLDRRGGPPGDALELVGRRGLVEHELDQERDVLGAQVWVADEAFDPAATAARPAAPAAEPADDPDEV